MLGFLVGDKVVNSTDITSAVAFVKAVVRDVKSYIKGRGYRPSLGVRYIQKDLNETSAPRINIYMANCLNCGDDAATVDFWGCNSYSWCGPSIKVTPPQLGHPPRWATFYTKISDFYFL